MSPGRAVWDLLTMEKLRPREAEGAVKAIGSVTQKIRNIQGGTGNITRVRGVLGTNPGLKSRFYTRCKHSRIVAAFQ
jgi:hypothetical protein